MIVATAGHVDHGKTSLVGLLTGVQTDRLEEEQARGLTIDLGFAHTVISGIEIGFVDVPGHIRFINNMLAGVSAVDVALLVIAADDGVMPQTQEHLAILSALAIPNIIVVLSKTDRVATERCHEVKTDIRRLLSTTSFAEAEILSFSAMTGFGRDAIETALIAAAQVRRKTFEGHFFRMAIDRVFTVKGAGTVVTGAIKDGQIEIASSLRTTTGQAEFKVRSLQKHGTASNSALAGDRVALNLTGPQAELKALRRGTWLTTNPTLKPHHHIDVLLKVQDSEVKPLKHWTPVHAFHAATHSLARIATLQSSQITPGDAGLAQLVSETAMTLNVGDRLIFRDQGATRTIASGIVIDPCSASRGRAKPTRLAALQQLANRTQKEDYADELIENTLAGVPITTLTRSLNWHPQKVRNWLSSRQDILLIDTCITAKKHFETTKTQLLATLSQFHERQPNAAGIDLSAWSASLPRSTLYTSAAIESLKSAEKILVSGTQARLPSAKVELPIETERLLKNLLPLLTTTPLQPPVMHDLAQRLNLPVKTLQQHLQPAVKAGLLIQPVKNRVFRPEALTEMRDCITHIASDQGFTVQQFRDTTGIGRNLCIELLEYFDARGLTRRAGNVRYLRH